MLTEGERVVMKRIQTQSYAGSFHHFVVPLPLGGRLMYTILSATEALCHIEKASPYGRGGGGADGEGLCGYALALSSSQPSF